MLPARLGSLLEAFSLSEARAGEGTPPLEFGGVCNSSRSLSESLNPAQKSLNQKINACDISLVMPPAATDVPIQKHPFAIAAASFPLEKFCLPDGNAVESGVLPAELIDGDLAFNSSFSLSKDPIFLWSALI
jgi:hypothetical protein